MISFPSTLNRGGYHSTPDITPSTSLGDAALNSSTESFRNAFTNMTSGQGFDNADIRYNQDQNRNELLDQEQNNALPSDLQYTNAVLADSSIGKMNRHLQNIETPFHLDNDIFGVVNNYKAFINDILIETGNDSMLPDNKTVKTHNWKGRGAGSLFSPYNAVPWTGIVDNVPLLDGTTTGIRNKEEFAKLGDCSVKELVRLSSKKNSILGQARYKYSDFMYCKDLGKISNNHMITLRKFAVPVGDNIYRQASTHNKNNNQSVPGDIGRLICWFDTDDNKLSDIMSYEYEATWKELNAKIQQLDSQEDDDSRGPMGKLINSMNPGYNADVEKGIASGGALAAVLQRFGMTLSTPTYQNNDVALGRNYDANKVYEPVDTIQNTHIYEGKLIFKHEFSLTFSYKLRAYDNINPKSAFLDLLGNILAVTYRKGHFWGGRQEILGPKPNKDGWNKANAIVDSLSKGAGNIFKDIFHFDFDNISGDMASLANAFLSGLESFAPGVAKIVGTVGQAAENTVDAIKSAATGDTSGGKQKLGEAKNNAKKAVTSAEDAISRSRIGGALTGLVKNKLGRPALYAFDSLLSGANVGLWHVTIGNPKNPIACFGNLIMTSAKITHSGPLGLDDFPTELKVTVSLKHARGRDATDIAKMYTKGENSIYFSLASPFTKINTQEGFSKSSLVYDKNGNPRKYNTVNTGQTNKGNTQNEPTNKTVTKHTGKKVSAPKSTTSKKVRRNAVLRAASINNPVPININFDSLKKRSEENQNKLQQEEQNKLFTNTSSQFNQQMKDSFENWQDSEYKKSLQQKIDAAEEGTIDENTQSLIDSNFNSLDPSSVTEEDKQDLIQEMRAINTMYPDNTNNEAMAFIGASLEEYNFNRDQAR